MTIKYRLTMLRVQTGSAKVQIEVTEVSAKCFIMGFPIGGISKCLHYLLNEQFFLSLSLIQLTIEAIYVRPTTIGHPIAIS